MLQRTYFIQGHWLMAYTYLILNLVFVIGILFIFRKNIKKPTTTWWLMLASLLLLTAIFDNLMIWAGLFSYNPAMILGIYVGLAPIEDFFYAILAAILVPILWQKTSGNITPANKNKETSHA